MRTQGCCTRGGLIGPMMMILVGSIFLIGQFVPGLDFSDLWPLLMIGAGAVMLVGRRVAQ